MMPPVPPDKFNAARLAVKRVPNERFAVSEDTLESTAPPMEPSTFQLDNMSIS